MGELCHSIHQGAEGQSTATAAMASAVDQLGDNIQRLSHCSQQVQAESERALTLSERGDHSAARRRRAYPVHGEFHPCVIVQQLDQEVGRFRLAA